MPHFPRLSTFMLWIGSFLFCGLLAAQAFSPDSLAYEISFKPPSCPGGSDGSAAVLVPDTTGMSILWNTGSDSFSISSLSAGVYSFQLSNSQVMVEDQIVILDPDPIKISLVGIDSVSCPGGSDGRIEVAASGGSGLITYSWNDPNQQELSEAVFLSAGTYRVMLSDSNNCSIFQDFTVPEPPPITITLQSTNVSCQGESTGSISAMVSGGSAPYRYNWDSGTQDAIITNLAAGDYTLSVTDSKGCQESISQNITEPAEALRFTIQQDQRGCAGQSLNIASIIPSGGQAPYTFSWPDGQTSATANKLAAGPTNVSITDAAGCNASANIALEDLAPIRFNLIATRPSCNGSSDGAMGFNQLSGGAATNDSEYSFAWSNGSSDFVASQLSGGITYGLTVTDPQGCSGERERFLEDPIPIQFNSNSSPPRCFNSSDGQISITDITGPNPGNYTIQWSDNAGNSNNTTLSGLDAGLYTVHVVDQGGCSASEKIALTAPEQLLGEIRKTDATCFGDTDGSILVETRGGTGNYTYEWSNGSTLPNLNMLAAGNYTLRITDANNCEFIASTTINQAEQIIISTTTSDVVCAGDATGQIRISATGGNPPYTYKVNDTGFSRNNEFIGLVAGNYSVSARDAKGCVRSKPVQVADGPAFSIDLGPDTTILLGDSLFLMANYTGAVGIPSFLWQGSYDGTLVCRGDSIDREASSVVFCPRPNAKPNYEIDYTLLLIDENGCEAEGQIRVRVEKIRTVEVPSGFTPNGDGQNDLLLVHGWPGTMVSKFQIFDRWGQLLYEDGGFSVNEPNKGWDGTYQNQPMKAGTYIWQMELIYEDGSFEILSGSSTLLR